MKKIYYKRIIGLFFVVFFVATASSCSDNPFNEIESGDWVYSICENDTCAIIGLTEIGKKKDIIVIPTMIDNYEVRFYGLRKNYKSSSDIVFDNCKKIYCNYSSITICTSFVFGSQKMEGYFPHKFGASSMNIFGACSKNLNADLYVSNELYEYNTKEWVCVERECSIANIEYYIDEKNCFFVDNVESGKIEVIPPTPLRYDNEGYVFEGWYYNDIKWDFENNLVEDYFDENKSLRLIAKWEKE